MNRDKIEEIRQNISCRDYLEKSKYGNYCCPFCDSGHGKHSSGALALYDSNRWKCHKCGKSGDVIDLIEYNHNVNFNEALEIGANNGLIEHKIPKRNKEQADYSSFFLSANKNIDKTDYHRGLSLETLNRFKIGFVEHWRHPKSTKAPYSPRLIIPTSKHSYLARDTRSELSGSAKQYAKIKVGKLNFLNIEALQTSSKPIFVVEGELDALSIIDVGGEAISLGSIVMVKAFLDLVKTKKPKQPLIIALDNDKSGEEASQKLMEELKALNFPSYRINPCEDFKDASEALQTNREAFAKSISEAQDRAKQERMKEFSEHFASNRLKDFVNGIADSVNTTYIPTGFKSLDNVLDGGLYEGLYIMGAISSLGKTTLALQVCDQIARDGGKVLIFSLEMSMNELIAKSISRHTVQIALLTNQSTRNAKTTRGITTGSRYNDYSREEKELINNSINKYKEYAKNICIYEGIGDMGVNQIRQEIDNFICLIGEKPVVLIDYVQILAPTNIRATDKQNIDKAVIELKRMSRDFKIPVIGISSFNRSSYRGSVTMEAFKESGSLEYGSDVLIGLQFAGAGEDNFDVNKAKMQDPREVELVILKNRNGAVGQKLRFDYYPMFNYFKNSDD